MGRAWTKHLRVLVPESLPTRVFHCNFAIHCLADTQTVSEMVVFPASGLVSDLQCV